MSEDIQNSLTDLNHSEEAVRLKVMHQLGQMGIKAKVAIPELMYLAIHKKPTIRQAALNTLEKIDKEWPTQELAQEALPEIIKKLDSMVDEVAKAANQLLIQMGRAVVPALVGAVMKMDDYRDQQTILDIFRKMGPEAFGATPILVSLLKDKHERIRQTAAEALAEIDDIDYESYEIEGLLEALKDTTPIVRVIACRFLAADSQYDEVIIPVLLQLLGTEDAMVRETAIKILVSLEAAVVPWLIKVLEDRNKKRNEDFKNRIDEANDILKNFDPNTFRHDPQNAIKNLSWHFYDIAQDLVQLENFHISAIRVLKEVGDAAKPALPVLIQSMVDPNPKIRVNAVHGICHIGHDAQEAIPIMVGMLVDPEVDVRAAVQMALPAIDENWRDYEDLQKMVQLMTNALDKLGTFQSLNMEALVFVGHAAVPSLMEGLQHQDRIIREACAKVLGQIGPDAAEAVEALQHVAQKDDNNYVKAAARNAIENIIGP